ncbi:MAG TPA: hypothetical protein VEV15_09425 [Flavisolibacter sp.]|nr:hypothetical protein [Flavisolibacter sp.]
MEKDRILHLVTKKIAGDVTSEDISELQHLLQKNIGFSDAHKIFLHLYTIQSLVTASELVYLEKIKESTTAPGAGAAGGVKNASKKRTPSRYLSPRFFVQNSLFKIYCALTLRQLSRVLY